MLLAKRMKKISASPTLAIDAKAKQLKSTGVDVVNFGVGEPDFDTPNYIKEAAIAAIRSGYTKYTPAAGSPELREAVCEKLRRENGLNYSMKEVVINCGAKHSIYNVFQAMINPGDEVIIPSPYWVTYPEAVKLAGGKPMFMKTTEKTEFKISAAALRRKIHAKTKMLVLNSPSNPTGSVYTESELKDIMEVAVSKKIYVMSDEIYEHLIYDGLKHVSIAQVIPEAKKWVVVINGVSKSFAMTGWRIGYTAGPVELITSITDLQSHSTSNPSSIAMKAAMAALTQPAIALPEMHHAFLERRDYVVKTLNTIPGFVCIQPHGAFYAFPNVTGVLGKKYNGKMLATSMHLAEYLLDEAQVAVVPGEGFGAEGYIRISYATSMENIQKGLERIRIALTR